jgi:DNA-binding transcriptional ArsR family regulator
VAELADITAVLADRTRARILEELLGGVPLTAGSLAVRASVAASTVTGHLARLEDAGLVSSERVGRAREVRLAGPRVANALEALAGLADEPPRPVGLRAVNRQAHLRHARSCYDHLAGRLGVALFDALVARGALARRDGALQLGDETRFVDFGVDLAMARAGRRTLVRGCRDWTERREHLAGAAGAATLDALLDQGWLRRAGDSRALRLTASGEQALAERGVNAGDAGSSSRA